MFRRTRRMDCLPNTETAQWAAPSLMPGEQRTSTPLHKATLRDEFQTSWFPPCCVLEKCLQGVSPQPNCCQAQKSFRGIGYMVIFSQFAKDKRGRLIRALTIPDSIFAIFAGGHMIRGN